MLLRQTSKKEIENTGGTLDLTHTIRTNWKINPWIALRPPSKAKPVYKVRYSKTNMGQE
jgi:hypothetical protein